MAGHGAAAFSLNDFIEMRDITDLVVRRETSDPRRDRVRSSMIEPGLNGEREWGQVRCGLERQRGEKNTRQGQIAINNVLELALSKDDCASCRMRGQFRAGAHD